MSTGQYGEILKRCFSTKTPLYVYGGPGIGKSEIPRQVFAGVADTMHRTFLEWTNLTSEQKADCIKNPEKYWIFCDQRVGQMDSTDLRGIPNLTKDTLGLECIPMSWVIYFTQTKAAGAIFFDELNLAAPTVAGQAYQIINDRTISDRKLADDVYVFGAGNRQTDQAHVFAMPFPLRDRFCECEIRPDSKEWTTWASGKVNPHLIAFVNWKESYLYRVDKCSDNKSSTPRGIVRASKLVNDMDITSNDAHMLVSISVGESFATEFQAYCKHFRSLDWKVIYSKPETVENFEIDKLWAVVGGMAEQFGRLKTTAKDAPVTAKVYDSMMNVILHIRADFAIVTLRMMKDSDAKKFGALVMESEAFDDIFEKYGKYIKD
jgi:hypothetical protein